MDTLYYYPGACSLSVHAVLEETGHAYQAKKIDIHGGDNATAEYLAINARGLVPVLATGDRLLTEAPAILLHLAETHPEAGLVPPPGSAARTRCYEWLFLGATYPHPAFSHLMRPERFIGDAQVSDAVRACGRDQFWQALQHLDGRLAGQPFALGDTYSICDPYLMIFYLWGRFVGLPVGELGAYSKLVARVVERPAVKRAISDEQLPVSLAA